MINTKTLAILLCVLTAFLVEAQQNSMGVVNYGHKESFGMGAPIGIDYNANLVFNSKESSYLFASDSLEGKHIREMKTFRKSDKAVFLIQMKTSPKGYIYNLIREENMMLAKDLHDFYVKDSIPSIAWDIKEETKVIGGLSCTKAEASFNGRDYTAWFTFEIPLPYGPWKLNGLPGIILEAYDTNKEIFFYFKSIEYPSKNELFITKPFLSDKKSEWISSLEYAKGLKAVHIRKQKVGMMLSEQSPNANSSRQFAPMLKFNLESFDE
ncbi:hypothetical protein AAU57_14680 [Nonlabens sp. YIK11]|uniref:GLPGLI family protein n=1 Tax=Nonlabens sp. YIK11 TaxID=1453349 RepID=UPI0007072971|nr:GLPGLI family protein [Nonlabens sp. YIK11]KQC31856.1 hypothetical protein AAU57_14680 [Nonlabens sp. YIK11]